MFFVELGFEELVGDQKAQLVGSRPPKFTVTLDGH